MPAIPPPADSGTRPRIELASGLLLAALVWALSPPARADDLPKWDPVTQADLAGTQSAAYPDAPAEVLSWKLGIDDSNLTHERAVTEYIRYKVYDPSRAADITRIAAIEASVEDIKISDVTIHGRLTLPGGTVREIGQDSIHKRPLVKRATEETFVQRMFGNEGLVANEQFVAVEGMKPGSVLEFQLVSKLELGPSFIQTLQKPNIPVRRVDCTVHLYQGREFDGAAFVVNPGGLPVDQSFDKSHGIYHVSAANLPPLVDEPLSPSIISRSVTVFDYEDSTMLLTRHPNKLSPVKVDAGDGPWAPVAAKISLIEEDATMVPTESVANRVKGLIAGAASETEKARRIHNFVRDVYTRFRAVPAGSRPLVSHYADMPLDLVMSFDEHPKATVTETDFLWLELAMDREAGLEAEAVLLPDRNVMPFNPRLHSALFLPRPAVRVRVDGAWRLSLSNVPQLFPFGWIPARYQSGAGLIVKRGAQEFVEVQPASAAQSTVEQTGTFALAPDGSLAGHGRRRLTGAPAIALRPRARNASEARFKETLLAHLKTQFPGAEVSVTSVAGMSDPDVPVEYEFDLKWPDYATATKTRLIFKPFATHGQAPSPFDAAVRKNSVQFPFRWREIDDVSLQLPEGYALEAPSAPQSALVGDVLAYKVAIRPLAKANGIHIQRDFVSDVDDVPAKAYPTLKKWYELVAQGDAHELVLAKSKPAAAPAPATSQ